MNTWPTKKLGEVAEFINGYAFSLDDWTKEGLPIIRIQNLNDPSKPYNYFQGKLDDRYYVNNEDVLIAWSASLGVYLWDKGPAWLNQHIFKVKEKSEIIDRMYFYFVMKTVLKEMKRKVHGGTMQHITKRLFEQIRIPVPPLPIQQKIVKRLDAIRKAQELNEKQISLTDELFQSLLYRELGRRAKDWDKKKIRVVAEVKSGFRFPMELQGRIKPEIPFYKVSDMNLCGNEFRMLRHNNSITEEETEKLGYSPAPEGTIIFPKIGAAIATNKKRLLTRNSLYGNNVMGIVPKESILSEYLYFWLITFNISRWASDSNFPSIKKSTVKNFKIPFPSLKTQRRIVKKLSAVQEYKKKLLKQKELLRELFDSVLDKCMKGEFDT